MAHAEMSGANAQAPELDLQPESTITDETVELTDEVVPVFVEKEVIQALPEEGAQDSEIPATTVASLRELVASTPTAGELSDELRCLAGAVYFESRGEPLAGQLAVAKVVINRAEHHLFPGSYCGVVYQRAQFSFVKNGRMPQIKRGSAAWRRAKAIARIAHQDLWDSAADDSLYFHATYVRPSWSRKKQRRAAINTHIFYR